MSQSSDPRFRNVEVQYQTLKSQLASGALTVEQFESALQGLMILDEQGRYWMMGAESGRWYVYEGQNWIQRDPAGTTPSAPPPVAAPPAPSAAAPRPDAATLVGFTPPPAASQPDASALRPDQAPTLVGFTPPPVPPPAAAVPPAAPPPADTAKRGGLSPVMLMALLFVLVCILGVIAVGAAAYSRFFAAAPLVTTGTPAATQAPLTATETPAPSATRPAAVSPTRPPTNTPVPTTPAQRTPPVVVIPSVLPTVPPAPTATDTPPAPPTPTNTPEPPPPPPATATRTPVPQFNLTFNYQGYERWGTPDTNCTSTNNRVPVWQFKWDVTVVNRSNTPLTPLEWQTAAVNNEGGDAKVCTVVLPTIGAGQTAKGTFAAYIRYDGGNRINYVERVIHRIRNSTFQRCLDATGKETPC